MTRPKFKVGDIVIGGKDLWICSLKRYIGLKFKVLAVEKFRDHSLITVEPLPVVKTATLDERYFYKKGKKKNGQKV
jgi:hypothetical protein